MTLGAPSPSTQGLTIVDGAITNWATPISITVSWDVTSSDATTEKLVGYFSSPAQAPLTRYVVQGIGRDDLGAPLSGAALLIGEELVFSDGRGRFFARFRSTRQVRITVLLEEFLVPGRFRAEEVPAIVRPQLEGQASDLTVVVRREDRNDEGAATP